MHITQELMQNNCFIFAQNRSLLRITGKDAKDFLQRMSTNNLNNLTNQNPLQTSFVNNKGRMVDHCLLFETDDHEIIIVSSHKHGNILYDWLLQFHFIEDFILTDISHEVSFSHSIARSEAYGSAFTYWQGQWADISFNFYAHLTDITHKGIPISEAEFETLRVASLMPTSPFEINNNFMPQNINLEYFIADNKGCYIGQEVIAKARTYQKNVKTLGGAFFSLEEFSKLALNSSVVSPNGEYAKVTSLAPTYVEGLVNALVIIDSKQAAPNNDKTTIKAVAPFRLFKKG